MAKLVRDKIPDILRARGLHPAFHEASHEEYWDALLAKLKEEVDEFLDNPNEAEFSDILELVDEIVKRIGPDRALELRELKASQKGTFSRHLILDSDDGATD